MLTVIEKITSVKELNELCMKYRVLPMVTQPSMVLSRICEIIYETRRDIKLAVLADYSKSEASIVTYDDIVEITNSKCPQRMTVSPNGGGIFFGKDK